MTLQNQKYRSCVQQETQERNAVRGRRGGKPVFAKHAEFLTNTKIAKNKKQINIKKKIKNITGKAINFSMISMLMERDANF